MPSDSGFAVLEQFTETMKSIVEITEAIGGEKWVTISTTYKTTVTQIVGSIHLKCENLDLK